MRRPAWKPANIGPPETVTTGMSSRAAAITMPGTILSQLGINTSPSRQCARAMISTESAMTSRLTRE